MKVLLLSLVCCALWKLGLRGITWLLNLVPWPFRLFGRFALIFSVLLYVEMCISEDHFLKRVYKTALGATSSLMVGRSEDSEQSQKGQYSMPTDSYGPEVSVNVPFENGITSL